MEIYASFISVGNKGKTKCWKNLKENVELLGTLAKTHFVLPVKVSVCHLCK